MTTAPFDSDLAAGTDIQGRSLWADARNRLLGNRAAVAGVLVLAAVTVFSVVGPWLSPHHYHSVYGSYVKVPPSLSLRPSSDAVGPLLDRPLRRTGATIESFTVEEGRVTLHLVGEEALDPRLTRGFERTDDFRNAVISAKSDDGTRLTVEMEFVQYLFVLGTDSNGRDLLTRIMYGGRISLTIGLLATVVSLVIGVTYGATSGFLGGAVDSFMMRVVDILYSIPFMFFVILLMVFFGRNFILMFIAVGAIEWLDMARIVRGQTLSIKRKEYIEAAHAAGVGNGTIIRRHIVPNTLGPVVVYMSLMVPKVILLESLLSFLGLGVQEPMTSWGVLIADGANNILGGVWLLIFPALFLAAALFSLNFIGDGLRDALDPKDR